MLIRLSYSMLLWMTFKQIYNNWQNGLLHSLLSIGLVSMLMPEDIASYHIVKVPHQSMQTQLSYQHNGHIDRRLIICIYNIVRYAYTLGLKRIVYFDIRIFFNFQTISPNILLHIKVVK